MFITKETRSQEQSQFFSVLLLKQNPPCMKTYRLYHELCDRLMISPLPNPCRHVNLNQNLQDFTWKREKKLHNTDIKSYVKCFQKLNKDILLINIVYHLTKLLEENKQLSQTSVAYDAKKVLTQQCYNTFPWGKIHG